MEFLANDGIFLSWELLFSAWKWSIILLVIFSVVSIVILENYHFRWMKHFWMPIVWIITACWVLHFVYKGLLA